ncbi:MAG: alpha/beta hydrolase [Acetobacteraceae bacterium]|nr:alpha/beta hydrolase [Acetobacteraceae bacterium]
MPATAQLRGVSLPHEMLGDTGPVVVITPGGRRGMASDRALGLLLAEAGFRALVWDRRNTGAADIALTGESESAEQAEDLYALLKALGAVPAYVAGCSSGARASMLLALGHPHAVRALLLWRVTGGPFAAQRLAFTYYGQFLAAVARGGIDAVAETEHFAAMIRANPANRARLDALGAEGFRAAMERWLASFRASAGHPVAGLSPGELRRLTMPALVVPGNDRTHPAGAAQAAHRLIPNSLYREVLTEVVEEDVDFAGWEAANARLAAVFIDALRRFEGRK